MEDRGATRLRPGELRIDVDQSVVVGLEDPARHGPLLLVLEPQLVELLE